MTQFQNSVPFDPGYSDYFTSIPQDIYLYIDEIKKLKVANQVKFKLSSLEASLASTVNQIAAVYLGCMLWGAFIHYRFKESPKPISDNPASKMTQEELDNWDNTYEHDFLLDFITRFDKDCRHYLKRPFKITPKSIEIINAYREFTVLNDNFKAVKFTSEIKMPKAVHHFDKLSPEELESLYIKIIEIIKSRKISNILDIGFEPII